MSNLKLVDKTKEASKESPGKYDLVNHFGQNLKFSFDPCDSHCCIGVIRYTAKFDIKINGDERMEELAKDNIAFAKTLPKEVVLAYCHIKRTKQQPWTYLMSDAALLRYRIRMCEAANKDIIVKHRKQKKLAESLKGGADLDS